MEFLQWRPRTASGELPITTDEVRDRLSGRLRGADGSLVAADSPDVQRLAVAANPSRALVRRECRACGHYWQQPAATGRCPSCHSDEVATLGASVCMALRV